MNTNLNVNNRKSSEVIDCELYRVTEYDESMESSASVDKEFAAKFNDVSLKLTSSLTDKFPKLSIASLTISDTSYQTSQDLYKKSCLDYSEPLDLIYYSSPEKTDNFCNTEEFKDNQGMNTTDAYTMSDTGVYKSTIDQKGEYCNCSKCEIF